MIFKEHNKFIPKDLNRGGQVGQLDKEAIAFFLSAGFFPENDTYWKDEKWNELDFKNQPWKYEPRNITLAQVVDELTEKSATGT